MEERRIESEMAELAKLIAYPSEDVGQLAIAMRATPEGDDQFCLSGYKTIGDAIYRKDSRRNLFAIRLRGIERMGV